jgi:hypothetical protein
MSSWYLKVRARHLAPVLLLAATRLPAADVQTAWIAEASTEWNTNRGLEIGADDSSLGYSVEAGALFKFATPKSSTTLRPILGYVTYPDENENSAQGLVDLASVYTGQRSQFTTFGRLDVRDTFSSELAQPGFNDITPGLPTTPETGRISSNATRTLAILVPSFQYSMTQRADFHLSSTLQMSDYSGASNDNYVPYMYYSAETGFGWKVTPVSRIAVGVFAGKSDNMDDDGQADVIGAALQYSRDTSEKYGSKLRVTVEQDDVRVVLPVVARDKSTNIGADYTVSWKGEISAVDLNVGSTFTPSGSGGIGRSSQVQLEFHRKLSPRSEMDWAARYIKYEGLVATNGSDYDYLNTRLALKWNLSRTWYLGTEVAYWREKFKNGGDPDNVHVSVSFGYQGLQR